MTTTCDRCNGIIDSKEDIYCLPFGDPSGWQALCQACHQVWVYNGAHRPQLPPSFFALIKRFNEMYGIDSNEVPTDLGVVRIQQFFSILQEELKESDEIYNSYRRGEPTIEQLVAMADLLGDIIVYCASEAQRWGIPIEPVLQLIMESQWSKLGADGKPILDARNKVMKGPGYQAPEPRIRALLERKLKS